MPFLKFLFCAAIIFFAGRKVAKYGDILAEKTGLGGLWIGLILMAIATSLPEIFVGVGSSAMLGKPELSIGNLFGANTYNLLNIAFLDFFNKSGVLFCDLSVGLMLIAALSLLPVVIAEWGIFLSSRNFSVSIFNISVWSFIILITYLVCVRVIHQFEMHRKSYENSQIDKNIYQDIPIKKAWLYYFISATIIVIAGIWLSYIGDEMAIAFNLRLSFVGTLFFGLVTTLPEITVSMAALKLGAKEMAVANMIGSNLFNISVIFLNDILYRRGDVFGTVSSDNVITSLTIVAMTAVLIVGIITKPKKKIFLGLSPVSIILIATFIAGAYLKYIVR